VSAGQKPDFSCYLKPAGSKDKNDRRYFLSGWVTPEGRLNSLRLDRKVVAFQVRFEDGEVVTVKKGADGKLSHYIDCFLRDGEYGSPPKDTGSYDATDAAFGGPPAQDDFGFDV
jgi:hypothetical protein